MATEIASEKAAEKAIGKATEEWDFLVQDNEQNNAQELEQNKIQEVVSSKPEEVTSDQLTIKEAAPSRDIKKPEVNSSRATITTPPKKFLNLEKVYFPEMDTAE